MKRTPRNPDSWWEDAYKDMDHMYVVHEMEFGKDIIKVGTKFKIKNDRGTYQFRCLAHNSRADVSWIDCVDIITREYRSFRVDQIKGLVKMRSRRRKINE